MLTAFSWVSWGSEHPWSSGPTCSCYSQYRSSCTALYSPGPPKRDVPRPPLNFQTHGVFLLVLGTTVDFRSPGPLHMLSPLSGTLPLPPPATHTVWLVGSLLRSHLFYISTVSFTALATTYNYFISYLYDHLTIFPTKQQALDFHVYCSVFKAPAGRKSSISIR